MNAASPPTDAIAPKTGTCGHPALYLWHYVGYTRVPECLYCKQSVEPADRMRELEAIAEVAGEVSLAWESDETEEFVEASDRLIVALRPWRERRAGSLSTTKVAK